MFVDLYEFIDGKSPIKEFIDSLDDKKHSKVIRNIELLENNGKYLTMPYSRHLNEGIFELRTSISNTAIRILYFYTKDNKAVLTNGFIKKTIKTPKKEIELAKKYQYDYTRRNNL